MNGLLTHSNLSFESFDSAPPRPPSNMSFVTNTSSNTVHVQGIGTLTGRIIYAFGESALRGIENLAIRRRLRKVISVFPHEDESVIKDIDMVYDHTLELSRFGLYRAQIRKQALRVLLIQIATRQTRHLIQCLAKWPTIEIALFIAEILNCMPENWLPPDTTSSDMHRELMGVYISSQRPDTHHSARPLIDFIMTVAQVNDSTLRAVFDSGFLDVLLCMYTCDFSANLPDVDDAEESRNLIVEAIGKAMVTLCHRSDARAEILAHPICVLWPKGESLLSVLGDRITGRKEIWRQLGPILVSRRVSSIAKRFQSRSNWYTTVLADAQIDLMEFSREDLFGSQISLEALTIIRQYIEPHWSPVGPSEILDPVTNRKESSSSDDDTSVLVTSQVDKKLDPDITPWYLVSNYGGTEILLEIDGSVKGGTVPALVERLTAHDHVDPAFVDTFLMTYKSFMTLNQLFDLLVQRFQIQPPDSLEPNELETWRTLKQHAIQRRVCDIFKSMIVNEDVLGEDDMYILDRIREFILREEVWRFEAAKALSPLIEHSKLDDVKAPTLVATIVARTTAPTLPETTRYLKLLDIRPLELARQLTVVESQMYQVIKPVDLFLRSQGENVEHEDSITVITRFSDRIALWVQHAVLSEEKPRVRATIIKYFIRVAEKCRTLCNHSSMVAIVLGLTATPVRRLKRSWELVKARFLGQLVVCEAMIDPHRNFINYRKILEAATSPCIPYIGVFLKTLVFIHKGSNDFLPNNMVNFHKHQKISKVINDIKRWQSEPHNFRPISSVFSVLVESLPVPGDQVNIDNLLWGLSLEREPRDDDVITRLLQVQGLL